VVSRALSEVDSYSANGVAINGVDFFGHTVVTSLEFALARLKKAKHDEVFIIGGERLYQEAIPLADKMYLTTVRKDIPEVSDSDEVAYFPIWVSTPSEWDTVSTEVFDGYSFKELERING